MIDKKLLHLTSLLVSSANTDTVERAPQLSRISSKTTNTLFIFVTLMVASYFVPPFNRHLTLPKVISDLWHRYSGMHAAADPVVNIPNSFEAESDGVSHSIPGEIEDPSGHALDSFFSSLLKTENGDCQTRICHYGDSPITNDGITSTVRRRLQLRFGDAGHGFILIDRPWGWYEHIGVIREASRGWSSDPMFISRGEHFYGLGCVSFTASTQGTSATFSTVTNGEVGRSVSAFDLYFLMRPGGGDFDVEVDGQHIERVSTGSEETKSGFHQVQVPEGPHKLTIRVVGNGSVQMFGVTLESSRSGVQYDSLGVNGAFIGLLANYLDADHWADQLRHRNPDLVIIGYGTNESQFEKLPMDQYEIDTKEAIRRVRAAIPEVSIMLLGPMDRGARGPGGGIITRPMIPKLVAYQRRIAAETGCAFFDEYVAMGGDGTAARWCEARPRLMSGDYTHPTAQGAEIVGSLLYEAISKAYAEYKP